MNHFAFITHALAVVLTLPVHGGEPLPKHDAITWRSLDLVNGVVDFGHMADELDLSNEDRQRIIGALDNIIRHAEAVKPELKPEPKPEPPPDIEPKPGNHGHFNALLEHPALDAAYSLRDPKYYVKPYSNGTITENRTISYDPSHDAAKITFKPGQGSIPTSDYLKFGLTPIGIGEKGVRITQWEARWSDSYLAAYANGLRNHKAFRFDRDGGGGRGESRVIELQTRFANSTPDTIALPTIRMYPGGSGGDGEKDPLSSNNRKDFQPGGEPGDWLIKPNCWTRFTLETTYSETELRIRLWLADETRDPQLVIADLDDPSKGFLASTSTEFADIRKFLIIQNTSQTGLKTPELVTWVRNIAIMKSGRGEDFLGGKPGQLSTEGGE